MKPSIRNYWTPIVLATVAVTIMIGCLRETGHIGMNLYKSGSDEVAASASVEGGRHPGNLPARVLTSPKVVLQSPVDHRL